MKDKAILVLGSGHLANRTKLLLTQKGYLVTHLPSLFPNFPSNDSSTIIETKKAFQELDMDSFSMIYILYEKDEDNLEMAIVMMALYTNINVAISLFNENIKPHLEKANQRLTILNPAKIAAPFFVEELDRNIVKGVKSKIKKEPDENGKISKDHFLIKLIAAFVFLALFAVAYFHFKEQLSWIDALYFVVVTISTVGYGDFNLQNSTAISKVIGIVLILCSTIFMWLIFSLLIDRIIKRRVQHALGQKKYYYKNHIILCGLGRLGFFIADELHKKGDKIVIIESNVDSSSIDYFRKNGVDVYIGNARDPHVLQNAGAENCRALISVINNDFANLEIGLNARHFQYGIRLVLRIFDETMADIIKEKFDIHLTKSMSNIAAKKFASLIE